MDERAAEVMEEMHIDECDDPITHYSSVAGLAAAGQIDCIVAVDAVAAQQAEEVAGGRVAIVTHVVDDPQATGGGGSDLAHLQVRYRQSFNSVQAFVKDLPSVLEQRL